MSETKKKVLTTKKDPCGCVITDYDDQSGSIDPCPSHGILRAAQALGQAAQALGAVGDRLLAQHANATMNAAAKNASKLILPS